MELRYLSRKINYSIMVNCNNDYEITLQYRNNNTDEWKDVETVFIT